MKRRVFVLGIDGGTFDVILPMVARGELPNLAALIGQGYRAYLASTIHPITASAWVSFATGCNPGKHGIYDFQCPKNDGYGFRLNSARDRHGIPFWSLLSRSGRDVIIVNVPFTYPPDRVRGVMLAGFDAPGSRRDMASPPEAFDDLVREFGAYTPDWTFPSGKRYDPENYRKSVETAVRARTASTLHLIRKYPWDVCVAVFGSVDHVQHIYYGLGEEGRRIIESAYRLVDEGLGAIRQEVGADTAMMVVSDHGFGPIRKIVDLDRWLEREGFLSYMRGPSASRLSRWVVRGIRRGLKQVLPVKARGYLRGQMPGVRDFMVSRSAGEEIEWSRTQAYSGGMYGNIYVNRAGLRPKGTVSDADYDAVRTEIADRLSRLRDPDSGEAVVDKVYRREDLYAGPYVDRAPDLIVRWKEYAYFTKKGIAQRGAIFGKELKLDSSTYPHTGTHRVNGIFIASGPDIAHGMVGKNVSIMDFAPTLLHYLGIAPPDGTDGRVVTELFVDGFMRSHPVSGMAPTDQAPAHDVDAEPPPTQADQQEIEERLRSLGYVD